MSYVISERNAVPQKFALLLRNTYIYSDKKLCEPFIGDVPLIFTLWKNFCYFDGKEIDDFSVIRNKIIPYRGYVKYAHIRMKNYLPDELDYFESSNIIENDEGWFEEYYNNIDRGDVQDINTVYISDAYSNVNSIVGSLLKVSYPSVKTIIFNRIRGSDNMINGLDDVNIENFIAINSQGYDNPFNYLRSMPLIKNALFEGDMCYYDKYHIYENNKRVYTGKYISFKDEFTDCLKKCKNLQQVLFFTHNISQDPTCTPYAYSPPDGWMTRFLKFDGPQNYYWIVYEKLDV